MSEITSALAELLTGISSVGAVHSVGGGCISNALSVTVTGVDGESRQLFVKSNRASFLDNFQAEADGCRRLGAAGVIGVSMPLAVGAVQEQAYLVAEWIDQQQPEGDFFAAFGRALADLHRATIGEEIGLDRNNYLGAARQINSPTDSWNEFVAVNRLEFQLRWAVDQELADPPFRRDCRRIIDSIDRLLAGREISTSLLHGDLWSGNYLCGPGGRPFIIDPAVYRGCREAEFGMLRLFGSCPGEFYEAYQDRFPLPAGWQQRADVYVLYHLMNHLNLFGAGYYSQCRSLAAEILAR